jgi:hypothetical protein
MLLNIPNSPSFTLVVPQEMVNELLDERVTDSNHLYVFGCFLQLLQKKKIPLPAQENHGTTPLIKLIDWLDSFTEPDALFARGRALILVADNKISIEDTIALDFAE